MYDFYFGDHRALLKNELRFLLSVKRMLPKWMNSIPDSEFIAIHEALKPMRGRGKRKPVFVETGAGASTLLLAYHALKTGGRAYSWDMNGEKGSQLRTAMVETMGPLFRKPLHDHWRFIAFSSLSPQLGLSILAEKGEQVDFFMHDSHHVLDTVLGEMRVVEPLLREKAVVALDDAHYRFRYADESYINIFRKKLGLPVINPLKGNRTDPFHQEVAAFLRERWARVTPRDGVYRRAVKRDIFFNYFNAETAVRASVGMERVRELGDRFHLWQVTGRRKSFPRPGRRVFKS